MKSQSDHLTKGRSVKAPEMTLPMVLEMPTTEMRKAAELAATPAHHIVQVLVLFIKSEYIKYVFTLAGGKLNKVDIGDVQPLYGEQVAQAEQQEGHIGQQPAVY